MKTDLVGLQEIVHDQTDGSYQSDQVAATLGFSVTGPTAGGLALLSRYPITSSTRLPVSHGADGYGADEALHAVVSVPTGDIDVIVAHLTPRSSRARVEAAVAITEYLDQLPQRPVAVIGDLNTVEPEKPELNVLRGAGLRDAAAAAGEAAATMPSHGPLMRLDYVFIGRGFVAAHAETIGAESDPHGYYPSDHLGVSAVVDM